MVTTTSVGSGNWSEAGTWNNGVPANGDSVVIASGHTVVFDVDESGFAAGLAGLTINGTLRFAVAANTVLKLACSVVGTGSLYVGNSGADPIQNAYTAKIQFNGAYEITGSLASVAFYGRVRTGGFLSRLNQAYGIGTATMVLKDEVELEANDVVSLSSPTAGQYAELLTVKSYTSATKTVVFTAGCAVAHVENDYLMLITKNIVLENIHASSKAGALRKSGSTVKGVLFKGFNPGPIRDITGCNIEFCTGQNNTNGGISYYGSGHTISGCTGQNNTYGGISYYGSGHTISGCTGQNNTGGGISYYGSGHTISGWLGGVNTDDLYYTQSATLFGGTYQSTNFFTNGYNDVSRLQQHTVEAFDFNGVAGDYRAWLRGGKIASDFVVKPAGAAQSWKFTLENASFAVHRSFEVRVEAGQTLVLRAFVRKSAVMAYQPRLQIVDPAADPLILAAAPLAETLAVGDEVDAWQLLTLRYVAVQSGVLLVRLLAKNASGNVWFWLDWQGAPVWIDVEGQLAVNLKPIEPENTLAIKL
jgi:hypothetical protein